MNAEPPPRLGNYILLLELASGGMATVYVAKQAGAGGFERLVVIKRVHRHLVKIREFHDMLLDEARVASLIRHPNVVSVDDVVEAEEELFLVLPYIESVSLSTLIEAARDRGELIPPKIVVRIIADALAGLSAAHDAADMRGEKLHVVHRDVSPHNIIVGTDGRSRIIDFGIAKAARRITTTTRDVMKGKLAYMSPEQARQQPLDARADLFALGAVLHESLTGDQLFKGEDQADVLLAVLIGDIPAPSSRVPDVSPDLDAVVKKALEREVDDRYQTGADFLESLEKAVAPAQGRDVAQLVERLCGKDLETRRAAVRELLDEPRPSGIPRLSAPGSGDRTSSSNSSARRRATGSKSDVTMAATPLLARGVAQYRSRFLSRGRALVAAGAGVLAIAGGIGLAAFLRSPPPAAPQASGASSPLDGLVPLVLTADAPIEGVTVDGLRSISLDANVARLHVAPWSGELTVRATLKGGGAASAVVREGGPYDVRLLAAAPPPSALAAPDAAPATASAADPAAAPASASAAGPAPAPTASAKTKKSKSAPPTTSKTPKKPSGAPDLKPNPFL